MQKIIPILGWTGFGFGVITAVTALAGSIIAIFFMLPGFLFSSIYVLLSTKYQVTSKGINPGYFGIILSSFPLIILLYFKIIK